MPDLFSNRIELFQYCATPLEKKRTTLPTRSPEISGKTKATNTRFQAACDGINQEAPQITGYELRFVPIPDTNKYRVHLMPLFRELKFTKRYSQFCKSLLRPELKSHNFFYRQKCNFAHKIDQFCKDITTDYMTKSKLNTNRSGYNYLPLIYYLLTDDEDNPLIGLTRKEVIHFDSNYPPIDALMLHTRPRPTKYSQKDWHNILATIFHQSTARHMSACPGSQPRRPLQHEREKEQKRAKPKKKPRRPLTSSRPAPRRGRKWRGFPCPSQPAAHAANTHDHTRTHVMPKNT